MDLFNVLSLIGGLCLFLFGMNLMGNALEKRAGSGMKTILAKLTTNKWAGLLTGLGVTAIIQSSSATTVMVVGFVNSALMSLGQGINVIMGANIGTTVTSWILSLSGIESSNVFVRLLKPSSFTPILALIGIIFYMFCKSAKKKDTGTILLGFATLMFGMETMSSAVSGLKSVPEFQNLMILFSNPILGVLVGAVMTAIIQSSSASVGILQALSATGQVTIGTAIPIIMGQNIGTCITAMISSIGTNRNAKRVALVHLMFNVFGTVIWLTLYCIMNAIFQFAFADWSANAMSIAIVHTAFNVLCTIIMLPCSNLLAKLACKIIPDKKDKQAPALLDDRLMLTPAVAIEQCHKVTSELSDFSVACVQDAIQLLEHYEKQTAKTVVALEEKADLYKKELSDYLIRLSSKELTDKDSQTSAKLLRIIGYLERMTDHAVKLQQFSEDLRSNQSKFSEQAFEEIRVYQRAVLEIADRASKVCHSLDVDQAKEIEPLERVINKLDYELHNRHVIRLQNSNCSVELGFLWNDYINELERIADRCSSIGSCVIDLQQSIAGKAYSLNEHADTPFYQNLEYEYEKQYALPIMRNSTAT